MLKALILACFVSSCATASHQPDAAPPPIDPAGTYALRSVLHLATPLPGPATALVGELRVAEDPSRYLIDELVAALPDGEPKTVAQQLAPFVAAYLDTKLATIAPRFAPGMQQVSDQLSALTQQIQTIETVTIDESYSAVRTVNGIHAGQTDVMLALGGIPEPSVAAKIAFSRGDLAIDEHRLVLPYTRMLRLALDRGIIPSVDPGAYDLGTLLRDLVDCAHLGQAVADVVGVGSPPLYQQACSVGMTAAASSLYAKIDSPDDPEIDLVIKGTARGIDLGLDGHMDGITEGIWTGTLGPAKMTVSVDGSTFEGARQ
jgi:hypothetical protein